MLSLPFSLYIFRRSKTHSFSSTRICGSQVTQRPYHRGERPARRLILNWAKEADRQRGSGVGIVNLKVAPRPASDSTQMRPPWRSTTFLQSARQSVILTLREVRASIWEQRLDLKK
jgi:hypothetical protein